MTFSPFELENNPHKTTWFHQPAFAGAAAQSMSFRDTFARVDARPQAYLLCHSFGWSMMASTSGRRLQSGARKR
jgi:hypothetical protein